VQATKIAQALLIKLSNLPAQQHINPQNMHSRHSIRTSSAQLKWRIWRGCSEKASRSAHASEEVVDGARALRPISSSCRSHQESNERTEGKGRGQCSIIRREQVIHA
jgi:hypothetical protein